MPKRYLSVCFYWFICVCALSVTACSTAHVDLGSPAHDELLRKDIEHIESAYPGITEKDAASLMPTVGLFELTLQQALDRGVLYNLDGRVAALEALVEQGDISLEQLKALPTMNASAGFIGRTNKGASSSRSVLTKQQSLEPSQSTEESRRTAELTATWNIIDAALAISESRTAREETEIARKRYSKVIQNIQRDVYSAYWRALAYQQSKEPTDALLEDTRQQIANIKQAVTQRLLSTTQASEKIALLSARQKELADVQNQMALAGIELKSLLSLPLDTPIHLDDNVGNYSQKYRNLLTSDVRDLEWEALKNRPEMQEEILNKNIAWRSTREEVIRTFPGLELFLGGNYDDNHFLENRNWGNYSAKILQSITALFTAPARYEKAKNEEFLADGRRQALALAIMAQTRIARHRLSFFDKQYAISEETRQAAGQRATSARAQQKSGFLSGESVLSSRLEQQIKVLEAQLAQAQLQDAYAAFANTLGREISPVSDERRAAALSKERS